MSIFAKNFPLPVACLVLLKSRSESPSCCFNNTTLLIVRRVLFHIDTESLFPGHRLKRLQDCLVDDKCNCDLGFADSALSGVIAFAAFSIIEDIVGLLAL